MMTDSAKVRRILDKRALASKIFLIGQALGEHTQRKSGRPYTYPNGELSPSGQNLDKLLRLFGYTIFSSNSNGCQYVYSSDIVQCYPGKNKSGHGDRKPSVVEVTNCISFLQKEIEVLEPRLILLMGKASRDSFYRYVLREPQFLFPFSLSNHINEIIKKPEPPNYRLLNRDIYVIPIQHPSGANPKFNEMFNNHKLISLIRSVLSWSRKIS